MNGYKFSGLTGGSATDLDSVSVSSLSDGDVAVVFAGGVRYWYEYDSTATGAESSPDVIRPDDYGSAGNWELQGYLGVLETMPSGVELTGGMVGLDFNPNSTDSEHDIDVAIGACLDSTNAQTMSLSTALTKRLDAAWASGTGNGCMCSDGALSSNTYYPIFLISNGTTVDVLAIEAGDTMNTTNLNTWCSGYSYFRFLGFVCTDASSNVKGFRMRGNLYQFDKMSDATFSTGFNSTSLTSLDLSSFFPITRVVSCKIGFSATPSTTAVLTISHDGTNSVSYIRGSNSYALSDTGYVWGAVSAGWESSEIDPSAVYGKISAGSANLGVYQIKIKR